MATAAAARPPPEPSSAATPDTPAATSGNAGPGPVVASACFGETGVRQQGQKQSQKQKRKDRNAARSRVVFVHHPEYRQWWTNKPRVANQITSLLCATWPEIRGGARAELDIDTGGVYESRRTSDFLVPLPRHGWRVGAAGLHDDPVG